MNALVMARLLRRQMDSVIAAMPQERHPHHRRRVAPSALPALACRWLLRHPADVLASSAELGLADSASEAAVSGRGHSYGPLRILPSLRSKSIAAAGHSIE